MELKNFDFTKKINLHPEQLVKLKNNKRPFPITIEVDLTNHCNHRCSLSSGLAFVVISSHCSLACLLDKACAC